MLPLLFVLGIAIAACGAEPVADPAAPPLRDPDPETEVPPEPAPRRSLHHVSPAGSGDGDGSRSSPWDLATALAHPAAVLPGDTVLIGAGTYVGAFESSLEGRPDAPIIVRVSPGERATIATDDALPTSLTIGGAHTWYWGFEVTNTDTSPGAYGGGAGVTVGASTGIKLIHLVIHDAWASGIQWQKTAVDGEVYGVISHANGRNSVLSPGKGGYGIYAQSGTGVEIRDNIFGIQGGNYSVHVYGENADLNDVHLVGNIIHGGGGGRWVQVGGFRPAQRTVMRANLVHGAGIDLGYQDPEFGAGTVDALVEDNVFATGDRYLIVSRAAGRFQFRGNTVIGRWVGVGPSAHPHNTFLATRPDEPLVYVRPSSYEPGRAHIAVYNWPRAATIRLDLAGVLGPGEPFVLHDAFDLFGPPVARGTWTAPLEIVTDGAEFRVFVVQAQSDDAQRGGSR